jgi:hypothetical protein
MRQHVSLRLGGEPTTKCGDHRQDLMQGIHVHAHIDADIVNTQRTVALQRLEAGRRVQRQAGVGFPVHGVEWVKVEDELFALLGVVAKRVLRLGELPEVGGDLVTNLVDDILHQQVQAEVQCRAGP